MPRYPFPRGKNSSALVVSVVEAMSLNVVVLFGSLVVRVDVDGLNQSMPFNLAFVLVHNRINRVVARFEAAALYVGHFPFILFVGHDALVGDSLLLLIGRSWVTLPMLLPRWL